MDRWGSRVAARITMLMAGALALGSVVPLAKADSGTDASEPPWSVLVVGTWQRASDPALTGELNGQLVLSAQQPLGPGHWELEVKAGNTPRLDGVSSRYPEANGMLQENPDHAGERQLGITQLFYTFEQDRATLSLGLLSSNEYLDTNPVANDEYRQFLGAPFINNPTIEAPSYAIAAVYQRTLTPALSATGYISTTADLQESTYRQLFDFASEGHGVFAATEVAWQEFGVTGNLGLWANTDASFTTPLSGETDDGGGGEQAADRPETSGRSRAVYGLYGNLSGHFSPALAWTLRAGWANPKVAIASNAFSVALAYRSDWRLPGARAPITLGAGLARTGVSPHVIGPHASQWQAEVYARAPLNRHLRVTADWQWIRHSEFDPAKPDAWVAGIRLETGF